MARTFLYNDQQYEDPGEGFTNEDVRQHLTQFFPEHAQATIEERTLEDGTVEVRFVKKAGTKGSDEDARPRWGIVELMGHRVVAGQVSEQTIFGGTFLRVDVPACDLSAAFTRLYGVSAIYSVTFVSEEVARTVARHCQVDPIVVYTPELSSMRPQLGFGDGEGYGTEFDRDTTL
jgi:PRTRC genetic system protein C